MSVENLQIDTEVELLINRNIPLTKRIYCSVIKYDLIMTFYLLVISLFGYYFILVALST